MDALEALNEAKLAVVKLNEQIQNQKAEIRQLKKYANESERLMRALLLSGQKVEVEFEDPIPGLYHHTLRIRSTSRQGRYDLRQSVSVEAMAQTELNLFSLLFNDALRRVWDGVWR